MARKAGSFIKLDRKILEWQWFKEPHHFRVFAYLLMTACYQEEKYRGVDLRRGDVVTSYQQLAQAF